MMDQPPKDLPKLKGLRKRLGRCYELCGMAALERPDWTLVHGFVDIGKAVGMGHAWLERDGWAYDAVLAEVMRVELYSDRFNAKAQQRVIGGSPVAAKVLCYGHWGPWNEANPPRKGLESGPWNEDTPAHQRP